MNRSCAALLALASMACMAPEQRFSPAGVVLERTDSIAVRSVAFLVHDLVAMEAFYSEAFGVTFHDVDTSGVLSKFGDASGVTIKLVPLRESEDFEGYPDLQLGWSVPDIERVIRIARAHGGRQEGDIRRERGLIHASVRDPDGNTLELYQRDED